MGRLGNLFPDDARLAHAKRQLSPGRVLFVWCDFTNPPKQKYVVLACPDLLPRPLLLVINSRISEFVRRRPHLLQCQVAIRAADYDWLRHDSYIDCSQAIDRVELGTITDQVAADVTCVKGVLSAFTCTDIVAAVQVAKTISRAHKMAIVEALALVGRES